MKDVMEEDEKAGEEGASRRVLRQLQRIERWVAILDSAASRMQGEETRGEELGASLLAAADAVEWAALDVGAQATRVAALVNDLQQAITEYKQAFFDFDTDLHSTDVFDVKLDQQNRIRSLLRSELAVFSENMTQASQHHEQDQGDAVRCAQS